MSSEINHLQAYKIKKSAFGSYVRGLNLDEAVKCLFIGLRDGSPVQNMAWELFESLGYNLVNRDSLTGMVEYLKG